VRYLLLLLFTVRYLLLALLIVIPGAAGVAVFGHFALIDWDALQKAYLNFEAVSQSSASLPALFVAEAQQNIHRINLFADGVWTLLSAIFGAIGIHGMCTGSRSR